MCQQTINRFGNLLRIQRLQKVVHRIQPEGVRGATGIPRGEGETRGLRKHGQLRSKRNAIFARQFDIEKDCVWPQLGAEAQS
jgi:hypothetical protein